MLLEDLGNGIRENAIVEKWLGYLLQQMSHDELSKLLEYYERIGWISPRVREKLLSIAEGIKSSGKGSWRLPARIHLTSLLFIAYIAGVQIPPEVYEIEPHARIFIENPEEYFTV